MEQDDDADDPEVGSETKKSQAQSSDPPPKPNKNSNNNNNTNKSRKDDKNVKKSCKQRVGDGERLPLHKPPPSQPLDDENTSNHSVKKKKPPVPRLIHPVLLKINMQVRYGIYGVLSSALFVVMYNFALTKLGHLYVPSTIYAATYLIFIPIQHAMASTMVFGWPDRYFPSLTSNVPIGLTAIALGSYLTAYLDRSQFDQTVEEYLRDMGLLDPKTADNSRTENNEFYTSFLVLVVTSLWSFILSVLVNAPPETADKKEQ